MVKRLSLKKWFNSNQNQILLTNPAHITYDLFIVTNHLMMYKFLHCLFMKHLYFYNSMNNFLVINIQASHFKFQRNIFFRSTGIQLDRLLIYLK
jgi:hypothetical protein